MVRTAYPKFNEIVEKCRDKIKENFSKYKNSWQNQSLDIESGFWSERLWEEIDEIFESKNSWEETQKEIIDAINILAFMYELTKDEIEYEKESDKLIQQNVGREPQPIKQTVSN